MAPSRGYDPRLNGLTVRRLTPSQPTGNKVVEVAGIEPVVILPLVFRRPGYSRIEGTTSRLKWRSIGATIPLLRLDRTV